MEPGTARGASVEAAVAAASRRMLLQLLPPQKAAIEAAYEEALAKVAESPARAAGIAVGEKSAAAILAIRATDLIDPPEGYRPATSPGVYVPTATPVASSFPQRQPWLMASASQFRPDPPPALDSTIWARDYNEVKNFGGKRSTRRTPEQTAIALFWEDNSPTPYCHIVRSVAETPGREVTQNARLYLAVAQAMDDATIACFDAKYHYNFWRPLTAIRNGDIDGNDYTERDATWSPLIETPMHPEYPCAHCVNAGAVGAVLKAELGRAPTPPLSATSLASGARRSWRNIEDFVAEVADARVYDGVHYRNSSVVGTLLGRKVGELVAGRLLADAT
jgi:hypothetical protein